MKYTLALCLLCTAAAAQAGVPATAPGPQAVAKSEPTRLMKNEAVRELPGGGRLVEEPPGPSGGVRPTTKLSFWAPGLLMPTYVIDSKDGLRECAWPWLDSACRSYVPKQDQRQRAWVVKQGGQWLKCPRRDSAQGCVAYDALPNMVLQD